MANCCGRPCSALALLWPWTPRPPRCTVAPCYLRADAHYPSYRELLEKTDWDALGPDGDPRCRHCLVHCGFEPAAVLAGGGIRDMLKMALWQIS